MKTEKYLASERLKPDKLGTSPRARAGRVEKALRAIGLGHYTPIDARELGQASASEITIGSTICLVSYETIVAYRLADGSEVASPRNYYSRTTDRTLDSWLRQRDGDVVRMEPAELHAALKRRFA